jgi:alpha-N-acetylglucosamine transferase
VIALATVTTNSFLPGTLVMLHSFRKHNPWFTGDIVLIHDQLSAESVEQLEGCRFQRVSGDLSRRVDAVVDARPDFAGKRARFYSLDTFRLRGYDKVLFCDSDLLFRHSIQELFEQPHAFVACGDGAYYRGTGRDFAGLGPMANTFNAGLLVVDHTLLTDDTWNGLLRLVTPTIFRSCDLHFTDQAVLNLYLAGRQHLAGGAYNFLLAQGPTISQREGLAMTDARVLHFNGPRKPWMPAFPPFDQATLLWRQEYSECQ